MVNVSQTFDEGQPLPHFSIHDPENTFANDRPGMGFGSKDKEGDESIEFESFIIPISTYSKNVIRKFEANKSSFSNDKVEVIFLETTQIYDTDTLRELKKSEYCEVTISNPNEIYNSISIGEGKTTVFGRGRGKSSTEPMVGTRKETYQRIDDDVMKERHFQIYWQNKQVYLECMSDDPLTLFHIPNNRLTKLHQHDIIYLASNQQIVVTRAISSSPKPDQEAEGVNLFNPQISFPPPTEYGAYAYLEIEFTQGQFEDQKRAFESLPGQEDRLFLFGKSEENDVIFNGLEDISRMHCFIKYEPKFGWCISEHEKPSCSGTYLAINTLDRINEGQSSTPFLIPQAHKIQITASNTEFEVKY
jgi:hypothetical protein